MDNIFTSLYIKIKKRFLRYGCPSNRFDDYYQEALLIFCKRINKGSEPVNKERFIRTACLFLWLKDKKNPVVYELIDGLDLIDENEDENNDLKYFLFWKHFKSLPAEPREIIFLSMRGLTVHEITEKLQFPNDKATIDKKHYWKEKLKELILSDPLYKMNYESKAPDRKVY